MREKSAKYLDDSYVFTFPNYTQHEVFKMTASTLEKLKRAFHKKYPNNYTIGSYMCGKLGWTVKCPKYCACESFVSSVSGTMANDKTRIHVSADNNIIVLNETDGTVCRRKFTTL